MNDNVQIIDLKTKDCKLVQLSGGASDGVTTCVHKVASSTRRPQGLYVSVGRTAGGLPVFERTGS